MVKITPKDKKLLKSSKVRDYLRKIEGLMAPAVPQIQQAAMDAFMYGQGAVHMGDDGTVRRVEPWTMTTRFTDKPLDPKKEVFAALARVKDKINDDKAAWDVLAHAVADYVSQGKRETGMWIKVWKVANCQHPTMWQYVIKRRNGKGVLRSSWYRKRGECVRMAQKTAKALGIRYKEVAKR